MNEYSTCDEFEAFQSVIDRLEFVITDDLKDLFTSKDSFIWFTMFNKFSQFGLEDEKFAGFLRAFKKELKTKTIEEVSFVKLDENRGTKDRAVVTSKLNLLTKLMCLHFNVNQDFFNKDKLLNFVQENVSNNINKEDVELYTEILKDLGDNIKIKDIILKDKPSILAIVAYACTKDIDLDNLFEEIVSKINFSQDQKEKYIYMKEKLEECIDVRA